MIARRADRANEDQIRQIYLTAFEERERDLVADLASDLLNETSVPESLHLVAEGEGELVGHVSFSPVFSKNRRTLAAYILAPLAVKPGSQKLGVGSSLVREGMARLADRNVGVILVYGDPNYYGRFGFSPDLAVRYVPPHPLQFPSGWLACTSKELEAANAPEAIDCVKALDIPELW